MRINNNIQALNAYRNLSSNQFNTSKNLERLSSGLRINRAADDAAGLAISEKMRAQIRGLQMAERNSLDGISLIQTAEGALTEVHSMLHRMRELAVQAANDTNQESDRKEIQKEIDQLTSEINRIGNATEFNSKRILNGGATKVAPKVDKYGVALATGEVDNKIITQSVKEVSFNPEVKTNSEKFVGGEYEFSVTSAFSNGDKITINGTDIVFGTTPGQIDLTTITDPKDQAAAIANYLTTNTGTGSIGEKFSAVNTAGTDKIILTQKFPHGSATAPTITKTSAAGTVSAVTKTKDYVAEVKGIYEYELTPDFISNLQAGAKINIGGVEFTAKMGSATPSSKEFDISTGNPNTMLTSLKAAIDATLSARFDPAVVSGNKLTLTEKTGAATGVDLENNVKIPETIGEYSVEVKNMFIPGEQIEFAGQKFTFVSSGANLANGEINVGNTTTDQASNIKSALEANSNLSNRFSINVVDNKITLKEKIGEATGVNPDVNRVGNAEGTVHFNQLSTSVNQVNAEWKTGTLTPVLADGTGKFTFNGTTVNITYSNTGTTGATSATGTSVNLTINYGTDATAEKQRDAILSALSAMKGVSSSPIEKFTFTKDGSDSISISSGSEASPESFNALIIGTTGDTKIANSSSAQLTTRGINAKSAVYQFDVTNSFRENETIKIGDFTFKGVAGAADSNLQQFSVDGTARDQANSLKEAIENNASLNGRYAVSITGTTISLSERIPGSEKTDGVSALTKPETDLTAAIAGQFSFSIERSTVGQSYTIDGIEIKVVNDSSKYNDEVNNGTSMRYSEILSEQAENLRDAIVRNPALGSKYIVSGTGNDIVLTQRPGNESAVLPQVMLSNTGDGDVFKSNLQIGPNQSQIMTVELNDIRSPKLGIATTDPRTKILDINGDLIEGAAFNVVKNVTNGLNDGVVEYSIDVTSFEKASAAIKVFDTAIERVNGERASLGALQNRLEHTINNLKVTHENLSSSESRIRDADMALEMTAFTKNNILNQSAQAMLAQANQLPQGVLQLLQG